MHPIDGISGTDKSLPMKQKLDSDQHKFQIPHVTAIKDQFNKNAHLLQAK
jgi:hypothetical protein